MPPRPPRPRGTGARTEVDLKAHRWTKGRTKAPPRPEPDPAGLPRACQWGHPITWLLDGTEPLAEGEALGACACSLREANGRVHNGVVPVLWRHQPGWVGGHRLRPVFVSQGRLAYALALRLYAQVKAQDGLLKPPLAQTGPVPDVRGAPPRLPREAPLSVVDEVG
jgi:hypothetical protein